MTNSKFVFFLVLLVGLVSAVAFSAPGAGHGQAAVGGPAPASGGEPPARAATRRPLLAAPKDPGGGPARAAGADRTGPAAAPVVVSNGKQDNLPLDDDFRSLSAWADNRNGDWDLYAQVLRADGTPNGAPCALVAFPGDQSAPALALDSLNQRYLLAWQDGDGGLYGWLVARDGSLTGHWLPLSSGSGVRAAPALAYDPVRYQYLLAWQYCAAADGTGGCAGGRAVYARLLDGGGWPVGEEVRLSPVEAEATAPTVEWAGAAGEYRVRWQQAGTSYDTLCHCGNKACRTDQPGDHSSLGVPSLTPSPPIFTATPVPWDDILVSDHPSLSVETSNEGLSVAGNDIYAVFDEHPGWVYFTRSTNGGLTFLPSMLVGPYGGMTSITRREGAGLEDRDLYVSFYNGPYIYFTRSTDGGASWTWPVVVRASPDNGWLINPKIVVNMQGAIFITWSHDPDGNGDYIFLSRSFDGGTTWLEPIQVVPYRTYVPHWIQGCSLTGQNKTLSFAWNTGQQFLFTRSTDGGQTWSDPVQLDDGNDQLFHGAIDLAVDPKGVLYAAWDDDRLGRPITFMTHSTDGGATWSPGVRVDDGGCVQLSWSGAITMDDTELGQRDVLVALMDGRYYCEASWNYSDVFLTRSRDQGQSWSPNEQVSNPIPYNNVLAVSIQVWGGTVYTAWDEYSSGEPRSHVMLDIHRPEGLPVLTPTPTATPTATPTRSPSPSPTRTLPATATPTPSPSPTPSWSPTAVATPTASPISTATPTLSPTPWPTPRPEWRLYLPRIEVRWAAWPPTARF